MKAYYTYSRRTILHDLHLSPLNPQQTRAVWLTPHFTTVLTMTPFCTGGLELRTLGQTLQRKKAEATHLIKYLVYDEIFSDLTVISVNLHIQTLSLHRMQNFHESSSQTLYDVITQHLHKEHEQAAMSWMKRSRCF